MWANSILCIFGFSLPIWARESNKLFNDSHPPFRGFRLLAVLFVTSIIISKTQPRPNFYGICVDCYRYLITRQCRWLGSIFFVHVLALAIYIPWYKMFANIGLGDNERRSRDGQADIPGKVLLMVLRDKLCTLGLFCVALTLWIENKIY